MRKRKFPSHSLANFTWFTFESSYSHFCRKCRAEVYLEVTTDGTVADEEINDSCAFSSLQRRPFRQSKAKELKKSPIPLGIYVCATNSLHHSSFAIRYPPFAIHIDLLWKFKRSLNPWMSAACYCRWCFQYRSDIHFYLCAHIWSLARFSHSTEVELHAE